MDVEFKLFGELTVRQFGYVAGGASISFICFVIFDGLDIVRWPLVIFFGILGLMLALFRVNDRPFEVWLANFLYAMFTSQRKVWKKSNKIPNILSSVDIKKSTSSVSTPINKSPLSSVYTSPEEESKNNVDVEEQDSLRALDSLFDSANYPSNVPANKAILDQKVEQKKEAFQKYDAPKGENPFMEDFQPKDSKPVTVPDTSVQKVSEVPLSNDTNASMNQTSQVKQSPKTNTLDLDDIIPETKSREDVMKFYDDKQSSDSMPVDMNVSSNLIQENTKKVSELNPSEDSSKPEMNSEYIKRLREQLAEQNNMINNLRDQGNKKDEANKSVVNATKKENTNYDAIGSSNVNADELATSVPNIIEGVIKDSAGKPVANATIIIKDSKLHPVRAMRSSNIGKFVTTTPLANGEYTLEASKGDMKFESVEFTLDSKESKSMEIFAI